MGKPNAESEQFANASAIWLTPKAPSGLATFPMFKALLMLLLVILLNSHHFKLPFDEVLTSSVV